MKEGILIEKYRDWEIYFYPDKEKFSAFSDSYDYESKTKSSLKLARKEVDDFIKSNVKFVPTLVQAIHSGRKNDIKKLVGIRRDGRFIYEDKDGKLKQFYSYDENDYFLVDSDNDELFEKINEVEKQLSDLRIKQKNLESQLKKVGLDTLKEKYKDLID